MFKGLKMWYRAWRRGEKRVGPKGATGRVYVKRNPQDETGGGNVNAQARLKGHITARVQRAGSNEWEDLGVIAKSEDD